MGHVVVKRLPSRNSSINAVEKNDLINNWCPVKLEYLFDMVCEK